MIAVELESWEKRWSALEEQLALCTSRHGYDADATNQLGEYVIGEGELAWRECAYESLLEAMSKESPIEDAYLRLILEDQRLTKGIIAKEVTLWTSKCVDSGVVGNLFESSSQCHRLGHR